MRLRTSSFSLGVLLVVPLMLGACSGGPTGADERLPFEFMVRSDRPYMRGAIVERTVLGTGQVRVMVRASPRVESGRDEAIVTVLPNAIIRWSSGRHGTLEQLQPGQLVTVWITGPELDSQPPQVTANGLILHSGFWR